MKLIGKYFKVFTLIGLGVVLSGCGFHLRGSQDLDPSLKIMYIQTKTPNDPFIQVLSRWLIANNVTIVSKPQAASAVLKIYDIDLENTLNALRGGAEAGEYVTTLTVDFSVVAANGKTLMIRNQVSRSAYYNSNATQILSSNATAQQLSAQLQLELAQAILQQLATINTGKQ
jgi:LPS-assembly lipoprotein